MASLARRRASAPLRAAVRKFSSGESVQAERVRHLPTTVFAEFTLLAQKHGAVNLGQGFPNFPPPSFALDAAVDAIKSENILLNQYTRSAGHPRLVTALADTFSPLFGRSLDPMKEIVTTTGATEAIFAICQGLVNPGDEVIMFEPFYDSYPASVTMAGGVPVYVPMVRNQSSGVGSSADWTIDMDALRAAFSSRTKLVMLNNPCNPVGKVFSKKELEDIAELVKQHKRCFVLSDEVYEWHVYPGATHTRFATLDGMWDRTLTIGSAGKSFSVTGWKVGWALGHEALVAAVVKAHQFIPFSVVTPLQEAVAVAFEQAGPRDYFREMRDMFLAKRDALVPELTAAGLPPSVPEGSYFVLADTQKLSWPKPSPSPESRPDFEFCRWLTEHKGLTAIPVSAFYSADHAHLAATTVRFCFCKTDEVMEAAFEKLRAI